MTAAAETAAASSTRAGGGGSVAAALRRQRSDPLEATCLCCYGHHVITATSFVTFILGVSCALVGVALRQYTQGWGEEAIDLLVWLCIWAGTFLTLQSIAGCLAARSGWWPALFGYFCVMLLVLVCMALASVYAYIEEARLRQYLSRNWATVSSKMGYPEGEEPTLEEAVQLMQLYLLCLGGVAATAVTMLVTSFVTVVRMLGLRAIAMCLLTSLGILGVGTHHAQQPRAPHIHINTHTRRVASFRQPPPPPVLHQLFWSIAWSLLEPKGQIGWLLTSYDPHQPLPE